MTFKGPAGAGGSVSRSDSRCRSMYSHQLSMQQGCFRGDQPRHHRTQVFGLYDRKPRSFHPEMSNSLLLRDSKEGAENKIAGCVVGLV